jgi:hypothetical protein
MMQASQLLSNAKDNIIPCAVSNRLWEGQPCITLKWIVQVVDGRNPRPMEHSVWGFFVSFIWKGSCSVKIKVSLSVGADLVKEAWFEIPDVKLEEYSVEETEAIIEVHVKKWADKHLSLSWESDEN